VAHILIAVEGIETRDIGVVEAEEYGRRGR
jgi:hypothetical protein